jgi:hypothetical protein
MSRYPDPVKARKQVSRQQVAYNRSPTGPIARGGGMYGSLTGAQLAGRLEALAGRLTRYGWTSAPGRVEP